MYRYEDETTGGSFLLGLLAGVVLGAGVGSAVRAAARRRNAPPRVGVGQSHEVTGDGGLRKASERVSDIVDRGRESYDRVRGQVTRGVDEVRRHAQDAASAASQFASRAAEAFDDEINGATS